MVWVKYLVDENYYSMWKTIELTFLKKFHEETDILWKSYAPENILNVLGNSQVAESLRTWYIFRQEATKDIFDCKYSDIGTCQILWFNRQIRSKSKSNFYYSNWYQNNIRTVDDLLNPPFPGYKLFEELVLDFNIPQSDRRKYNFLMRNVPEEWLENPNAQNNEVFDTLIAKLMSIKKIPSYAYKVLCNQCPPQNRYDYWHDKLTVPQDTNWDKIHINNFRCTIDTRLRSFYFKVFHKAIALNAFLYKIKRKDSPNCSFCDKFEETTVHLFCECEKVTPLWHELLTLIHLKLDPNFNLTTFEKLFGTPSDKFLSYLFLLLKYFIYTCKFKSSLPNKTAFKSFVKTHKETEYFLAKKRNKLPIHLKKWKFDV